MKIKRQKVTGKNQKWDASALYFCLLIFPLCVLADFESGRWPRSREILISDKQATSDYALVELDGKVYEGALPDLRDLRVLDDQGKESASKIILKREVEGEQERPLTIINQSLAPGNRSTITLDLGVNPPRHNRLRLETSNHNFSRRVTIESSDNNRIWELVRDDGYIFDFSRDTTAQYLTVEYPLSTRRYLRVSIENKNEAPIRIDDAEILLFTTQSATLADLPVKLLSQEQDKKERTSVLMLDLGYTKLPSSRIEFETNAKNFQRRIEISGSNDSQALNKENEYLWQHTGSGEIYDIQIDERHPQQLRVDYPEARYRYLRLRVFNYDDQPITIQRVAVSGYPRHLLFKRDAGRGYRLFYGNAQAISPHYDLDQIATYLNLEKLSVVKLGDEQRTDATSKRDESHLPQSPMWLWITLIGAGTVLAALIYKLARASVLSKPDEKG